MLAIFKREVKSYFYSPIAYVLMGFFILVSSIFFYLSNMMQQSGDFNRTMSTLSFLLIFIIPILTMRILAEDRKNGTEVLLITSPSSITNIVLGKYLAVLVVFLTMTALTLIYPTIIFAFGSPNISILIGSYLGFIFLGAALISIGVFASSLTENQIIAVVVSFVMMLIIQIIDYISNTVGGVIAVILNWFSLNLRYSDFTVGVFNIANVIYYISFIALFIFLTIRVIEKRRWSQG